MELCAAADDPSPAQISFAYAASHSVKPLPDAVIARLAINDGRDSGEPNAFDEPHPFEDRHDMPADVRIGPQPAMSRTSVCSTVASVARANDLPIPFFANLIWQESSFNPRVISPAGAQGIAQFMPKTAKEYGLSNPFDPVHALHAAGKFLSRLVSQFGNLGLAAAAYNAGPARVNDFMTRRRQLPDETRNYVARITGRTAEKWASRNFVHAPEAQLMPAKAPCVEVAVAVAAQARAVQLARFEAAAVAAATRSAAAAKQNPGVRTRVVNVVRTAVRQIKGVAVRTVAAKQPPAPVKLADRIAPDKSADRVNENVPQKPGKASAGKTSVSKTSVGKTSIVKTAQKSAPAHVSSKRTRYASAR